MKYLHTNLRTVLMMVSFAAGLTTSVYAQDMHMHGMAGMTSNNNVFVDIMNTMMMKMDEVPDGQSASKTFISQMMPHHEGAIAMADYEIRNGKNFDMIQLAKSIKAEQQSELVQMKLLLLQIDHTEQRPSMYGKEMDITMQTMMKNMPAEKLLQDTDISFARVMLPHHQAAVDMARVILKYPENDQVSAFAKQLISNEQIEIEQMSNYINK
ncbi:MAG: DUF305 domain-containing protein [Pedobacter sp.]|uniref:DUF305 domain-containing protein n=1 Tax=Pedobacter sp. TaxID=1411316 RepID=UPI0033944C57